MDFWLAIMMASCPIHLRESIPSAHEIYELYMIQRLSVLLQRVFHRESVTLDISGGPEIRHRFLVLDLPHIGWVINQHATTLRIHWLSSLRSYLTRSPPTSLLPPNHLRAVASLEIHKFTNLVE